MAEQVQVCADNFPPSVSEVTEVGFHTLHRPSSGPPGSRSHRFITNVACTKRSSLATEGQAHVSRSERSLPCIAPMASFPGIA
jgi:hypothetical protein